ncbi:MAG: hypothetical protein HQK49_16305 [Oligoflexia bacterium]|nr:hypothetical protein [Oligoflexia bacterium]
MKFIEFKNISHEEWDMYVKKIPESFYMHTSWWIDYINAINGKDHCKSFILVENNEPLVICPLAICKVKNHIGEYVEATFNGAANPYPAITQLPSTQRRRTVCKIFSVINEVLEPCGVKKIYFFKHPLNLNVLNGNHEVVNIAEAISFNYIPYLKNSIILDLKKDEDYLLCEMTKSHRKLILKAKKQGLRFSEYRGNGEDIDIIFNNFRLAHFKSSGRQTRPIESWNAMREILRSNKATLFTVSLENTEISYLYCGEFDKFSYGWSQVNIDKYEREYSPRHFLEWKAAMSYKRRGFHYYEVGIKYDTPQFNYVPTEKEITISQFKERYGGSLYCHYYFEKFLDKNLFELTYNSRLTTFMSSNYFSLSSQKTGLES